MHSFSSNAFFHACDEKMRQNLPAETIQIGVTEVPGQVRQTFFPSGRINLSTFHNMRFDTTPATSRENDRTLAAIEYRV